jgi:hypothetical protein
MLRDPTGGATDVASGFAQYECRDVGGVAQWSIDPSFASCCPVVEGVERCP